MMTEHAPFDFISVGILACSVIISALMLRLQYRLIKKVDADQITKRIESLEQRTASMPSHEDLTSVSQRLATMEGMVARAGAQIEGVSKALDGMAHQLGIIQQHLLNGKAS